MKKSIVLAFLLTIIINKLNSQSLTYTCYPPRTSVSSPSQPTTCSKYLNDFIPAVNDRVLEIKVNFWVFAPTTSSATSAWIHTLNPTTQADAINCLDVATSVFTNMPSIPQLTVAGVSSITNAKLKFTLKNFTIVNHDGAYNDIANAAFGSYGYNWHDPSAVNIFLGTLPPYQPPTGPPIPWYMVGTLSPSTNVSIYPDNVIYFTQWWSSTTISSGAVIDNIGHYGVVLAHELGHFLGLPHSTGPYTNTTYVNDPRASITSTFGCCSNVQATDYVWEVYQDPLSIPAVSCGTVGYSDNLMSQNSGCNRYLSPQQVAVIHHNLRTVQKHLLTSNGYTAATSVDNNFNYVITNNETWEEDRYMKGNITVNANKTLIIKCGVAMTKGSRIVVLPGGQLVIDGGKITNISEELWNGVYLYGTPFLPQIVPNPNNPGAVLYQGFLRMKNNATISNAYIGVRNYLSNPKYDAGGITFAKDANFINNVIDVDFRGGPSLLNSASWFTNCEFKTTGNIGKYNLQPNTHVNICKTNGVTFKGCKFEWISGGNGNRGIGITSSDATYFVDKNVSTPTIFKHLREGIIVNNINPLLVPEIKNTLFDENLFHAAYFINTNYLSFYTNTVQAYPSSNPEGIYLNNCKYFTIRNNIFSQSNFQTAPGIEVYKSQGGVHQIYRNTFSGLFMGINCMDNNGNASDGLLMNCNVFNITPNLYDVVMSHTTGLALPTVKKVQGVVLSAAANATNVVRNIYGATCGNQNKWQIYSLATQTIDHGSNTNSTTAVTQPTASGCKSPLLSVVNMSISLNYAAHCPGNPTSAGGGGTTQTQKLNIMNDYIASLQSDNPDGIHNYEIQTTVASKINLFLTDTLNADGIDSVIAILRTNQGNLPDARLQLVFAYMAKGDLVSAGVKIDSLDWDGTHPEWKPLMQKLLQLQLDTVDGIYSLNFDSENREFFQEYADTYGMEGQALAQAILKVACDSNYTEPHALPEDESGSRLFNQSQEVFQSNDLELYPAISVVPNPTQNGITLSYRSESDAVTKLEIKDLVGKLIYTNFIYNRNEEVYIPLANLANGMYLITVSNSEKVVYKNKIIKQD